MKVVENIFTTIYFTSSWINADNFESRSGAGSIFKNTRNISSELPKIIDQYNITSMLDAGCGDWNWMRHLNLNCSYVGAEIVEPLIKFLDRKYSSKDVKFIHSDIIIDKMDYYDLVMARDVLVHLPDIGIMKFLENYLTSKSKYLMVSHCSVGKQFDIEAGNLRYINWDKYNVEPLYKFIDSEIYHCDTFTEQYLFNREQVTELYENFCKEKYERNVE